ncbi:MAG: HmuY family protein [Myxococcaceae bacterium]|nr:HmuY family protein [Myxococcaceae bacterium]
MKPLFLLPVLTVVTVTACETLELTPGPDEQVAVDAGVQVDGGAPPKPKFATTAVDGGNLTIVQALSDQVFVAFDFDTGEEAPFVDAKWDIAFRRQRVRLRGGVNGDGGVAAIPLVDAGFADVTRAPDAGYLYDQPDGDDANTEPDTVFENAETWYRYDPTIHALFGRPIVYVVRSDEQQYFKVALESFYDKAGTPAVIQMRWAKLPAP